MKIEKVSEPDWKYKDAFSGVRAALATVGFHYSGAFCGVDFPFPCSVVGLFINEKDSVFVQYSEQDGALTIAFSFYSNYSDGKCLMDHYHYAPGLALGIELPSLYSKHLEDRSAKRPGMPVDAVELSAIITNWESWLQQQAFSVGIRH